jgi:hypothetical protein
MAVDLASRWAFISSGSPDKVWVTLAFTTIGPLTWAHSTVPGCGSQRAGPVVVKWFNNYDFDCGSQYFQDEIAVIAFILTILIVDAPQPRLSRRFWYS